MMEIYYIGGSPCSGKSTTAEILSKKHDLYYFKIDDYLDRYMQCAAKQGFDICKNLMTMSADEIWMREPGIQCREEFEYYREVSMFIQQDLYNLACERDVITEGAAYVPVLMKQFGITYNRYLSLTPTKEFQITHFQRRDFVPYILRECTDKDQAFAKWMERDILFAEDVRKQCKSIGYMSIVNDGKVAIEKMVGQIEKHFGLR